jgi:acetyl esterase/lipase
MNMLKRALFLTVLLSAAGAVTAPAQQRARPKLETTQPQTEGKAKAEVRLPEGTKVLKDLAYVPGGGPRQMLDLYLPKSDAPLPLIVWIHGGGWQNGSKDNPNPALPLLAKGYAVASINYRLSRQAPFPAQIQDCKEAIRWLRANAKEHNIDPDHIGAWGASAGGHLVALLGTTDEKAFAENGSTKKVSSAVQAVCDWFGPADFLHWGSTGTPVGSPNADGPIYKLFGGPVAEKKELAARASPVTHVSKMAVPFLIVHGDEDKSVPLQQSEELNEALKKAGVESTLYVIKGAGHGDPAFRSQAPAALTEEFFAKHLKAKK